MSTGDQYIEQLNAASAPAVAGADDNDDDADDNHGISRTQ